MMLDWGWIKQRPHFIAELLSRDYCVDVYYRKANRVKKKDLLNEIPVDNKNLKITGFRYLPFSAIPIVKHLNLEFINNFFIKTQLPSFSKYDYVWITEPTQIEYIRPLLCKNNKLIYDCMDDMEEFPHVKFNNELRKRIVKDEKYLLKNSNYLFFSAEYLKDKVLKRTGIVRTDVNIVNNALELPSLDDKEITNPVALDIIRFVKKLTKPLLYVGTIDAWFDFDSVTRAIKEIPDLNIVLLGPLRTSMPNHERIHYMGTVDRKYLFSIMPLAFALVMPFKLNELIKSVNPVKLYEYIYTGRPIIATKYGETEKFGEYVELYSSSEEFIRIINSLSSRHNSDNYLQKCRDFVRENTWDERYKQITSVLNPHNNSL